MHTIGEWQVSRSMQLGQGDNDLPRKPFTNDEVSPFGSKHVTRNQKGIEC